MGGLGDWWLGGFEAATKVCAALPNWFHDPSRSGQYFFSKMHFCYFLSQVLPQGFWHKYLNIKMIEA